MDLREYFGKIRQLAESLPGEFAVVVSKATGDGGKAGVCTEVHKSLAARLVVDGRADLASDEQLARFLEEKRQAWLKAEEASQRNQIQVKIVADSDWRAIREAAAKPEKD